MNDITNSDLSKGNAFWDGTGLGCNIKDWDSYGNILNNSYCQMVRLAVNNIFNNKQEIGNE